MSMAVDTTDDHADARGLGRHLGPCRCPWAAIMQRPCRPGWAVLPLEAMVISEPMLLHGSMCESMVLAQSGSVMSVTCGITNIHTDAQDLGHILWQ